HHGRRGPPPVGPRRAACPGPTARNLELALSSAKVVPFPSRVELSTLNGNGSAAANSATTAATASSAPTPQAPKSQSSVFLLLTGQGGSAAGTAGSQAAGLASAAAIPVSQVVGLKLAAALARAGWVPTSHGNPFDNPFAGAFA